MSSWIDLSSNNPLWLVIHQNVSNFSIPKVGSIVVNYCKTKMATTENRTFFRSIIILSRGQNSKQIIHHSNYSPMDTDLDKLSDMRPTVEHLLYVLTGICVFFGLNIELADLKSYSGTCPNFQWSLKELEFGPIRLILDW